MQNITRTLTRYAVKAYDVIDDADGMRIETIAETEIVAPSMTRAAARAALADAYGQPMPRGCTIKWEQIENVTYAMPLDEFVANAQILEIR